MLNIEVIKFEAQDVITASGVKKPAAKPQEPAKTCDCATGIRCQGGTGAHWYWDTNNSMKRCAGTDGAHYCGN